VAVLIRVLSMRIWMQQSCMLLAGGCSLFIGASCLVSNRLWSRILGGHSVAVEVRTFAQEAEPCATSGGKLLVISGLGVAGPNSGLRRSVFNGQDGVANDEKFG
jgi:hypothetical protein